PDSDLVVSNPGVANDAAELVEPRLVVQHGIDADRVGAPERAVSRHADVVPLDESMAHGGANEVQADKVAVESVGRASVFETEIAAHDRVDLPAHHAFREPVVREGRGR